MVQKGGEVRPRARKVHPPLSSSDVGGGLFVMAIASSSPSPKKLTLFKVNFFGLGELDAMAMTKRPRSEEHTSELQSRPHLVCRLLLEKKKKKRLKLQHSLRY